MSKKVYLDHSATTPLDPQVFEATKPYFMEVYGNASSIHQFGREARLAIDNARAQIARLINAQPEEIYFVSGGTEANNLAIKGIAYQNRSRGNHIITSQAEHDAVLNTCRALEKQGFEVTYLPVDRYGQVAPHVVKKAIKPETILISIIHGNNEIGTINPIEEVGRIAQKANIYFHSDAVQSFGKVPIDIEAMNISLMSVSGHKIYGPKGVGVLYIRKGTDIESLFHGGSHEKKRRPGTENVPGIIGIAKAAQLIHERMESHKHNIGALRDYFQQQLLTRFENVQVNGHPTERLYHNLNIIFEGIDSETLLLHLDKYGIAASNGSACNSGSIEPSHVLQAMGLSVEQANSAIRFTLGKDNTKGEIDYVISALETIVSKLIHFDSIPSIPQKSDRADRIND